MSPPTDPCQVSRPTDPVEVCFLVDADGRVLWSDRSTSASALPDSRQRWEAIWRHREELDVIAHSHPYGPLWFSAEDRSTMEAVDAALGRELRYAVVTLDAVTYRGPGATMTEEPAWVARLRSESGIGESGVEATDGDSQRDVPGPVG